MPSHLNLNILKRKENPANPPSPQRPLSTPPSRTPSRTTSPTVSPRSLPLPPSPTPPSIPNADPLPLNADPLEGLLNERSSQLQKLADRVESINEWLEMDGIVLAKLIQDIGSQADKEAEAKRAAGEAAERARALWKENNPHTPAASTAPVSPGQHRNSSGGGGGSSSAGSGTVSGSGGQHRRVPSGESRVPEVFLKGRNLHSGTLKSKEERVDENCSVRDLRERIGAMKGWRREIERTVCWQLEEYRRVLKAINRLSDESGKRAARRVVQFQDEGDGEGKGKGREKEGAEPVKTTGVQRDEGWGVGGQTWERKSGRVPSQAEWEELFSEGRIGWDDKDSRDAFLLGSGFSTSDIGNDKTENGRNAQWRHPRR